MVDKNSIIKLGVDICKDQVNTEFASVKQKQTVRDI